MAPAPKEINKGPVLGAVQSQCRGCVSKHKKPGGKLPRQDGQLVGDDRYVDTVLEFREVARSRGRTYSSAAIEAFETWMKNPKAMAVE